MRARRWHRATNAAPGCSGCLDAKACASSGAGVGDEPGGKDSKWVGWLSLVLALALCVGCICAMVCCSQRRVAKRNAAPALDHLLAAQDAQMGADDGPRMASTFMARAEGSFSVPGAGLGAAE